MQISDLLLKFGSFDVHITLIFVIDPNSTIHSDTRCHQGPKQQTCQIEIFLLANGVYTLKQAHVFEKKRNKSLYGRRMNDMMMHWIIS